MCYAMPMRCPSIDAAVSASVRRDRGGCSGADQAFFRPSTIRCFILVEE